jgi:hypothetical protein
VANAAGKKPGQALSDADLAKAQATLDKEIHADFKHQIVDQADPSNLDGPAVVKALTANDWNLFNRIATISDLGKSTGQIQMQNLNDYVKWASNNPNLVSKEDVAVAKYLQTNFDKFKMHESWPGGSKDDINFNSLATALGIVSDKPGDIMIKLLQEK